MVAAKGHVDHVLIIDGEAKMSCETITKDVSEKL